MDIVVDSHAHVLPDPVEGLGVVDAPTYLTAMAEAGVDRAVLVAMDDEDRYAGQCAALWPSRFSWVQVAGAAWPRQGAIVPSDAPWPVGLRATHLGQLTGGDPLDAVPALYELRDAGQVLWMYPEPGTVEHLGTVLSRVPGLTVVLNHLAILRRRDSNGSRLDSSVMALAEQDGVYVLLSGHRALSSRPYPYPDIDEHVHVLFSHFGTDRVLWGSDHPFGTSVEGLAHVRALVRRQSPNLSVEQEAAVLGGNAARLLGLGSST